jgi:hypothetical protein
MKRTSWEITLCWVKAHVGILGNELMDILAKKAAMNELLTVDYNRIPKSVVSRELEEESVKKWQRNWSQTTKGSTMKEYFPNIQERLKMKINLTQNVTDILTGRGKTKAYLHRCKIIKEPTCPCGTAEQTTYHVIFDCAMLTKEREKLKTSAQQKDRWPTNKQKLLRKHYRDFVKFINDIPFDKLTS